MKLKTLILTGLLGAGIAAQATASTITMGDANFARLFNTDQNGAGTAQATHVLNVGTKANSAGWDLHAGIAFQMTGPSAAELLTADFSVSYTGGQGTPIYNVDVYANRVASTSAFLISDFENGTKLMDDFVTTSDVGNFGNYSLDSTGQANLLTYLQSNWVAGEYLFITLKADTDPTFIMGEDANANYIFGGTTPLWTPEATDALLTVTAIPEPSTLALAALGFLGLCTTRRRRRR